MEDFDIAAKLSELLNSPEGLDQMKTLASALMGGAAGDNEPGPSPSPDAGDSSGMPDIDLSMLMKLFGMFKDGSNDSRSQLLLSLKPHLSSERSEKVDQAVKILKIVALWPMISESGILNGLF